MSRFVAEKSFRMYNENNELVVCFTVGSADQKAALLAMEEMQGKKIDVSIKEYKSKRSIEQNKLLWVLLGKMAEAMSGNRRKVSTEECYCLMLEETNVAYDYLLCLPQAEARVKESYRVVRNVGEREVKGKTLNMYQCFVGSSKYNVKEMTELIEATLDKLAELGVFDSEIEMARKEYGR